jgi:hypothetical protein
MNECPTCGRMIRGKTCPYCDEEVFDDEKGGSAETHGEHAREIFRCKNQWQADYITGLLESEGIPVYKEEGVLHGDDGDVARDAKGNISIQVEEEDAERAREIIEASQDDLDAQDE